MGTLIGHVSTSELYLKLEILKRWFQLIVMNRTFQAHPGSHRPPLPCASVLVFFVRFPNLSPTVSQSFLLGLSILLLKYVVVSHLILHSLGFS